MFTLIVIISSCLHNVHTSEPAVFPLHIIFHRTTVVSSTADPVLVGLHFDPPWDGSDLGPTSQDGRDSDPARH